MFFDVDDVMSEVKCLSTSVSDVVFGEYAPP